MGARSDVSDSDRAVAVPGVSKALGYVDRVLGFAVPAYGGAMRAYRSTRDHSASAWDRASLAVIGGLGGVVLSWMASVVVGAFWEREAVLASTPDVTYTIHAQPRVENAAAGTAYKLVSFGVYAAYLTQQPTDVTARLEVTVMDGGPNGGVEARCRYPVAIDRDTQFDTHRNRLVTLDELGRPVSITYGGQPVPRDSAVGSMVEEMCNKNLEGNIEDLNRSIR